MGKAKWKREINYVNKMYATWGQLNELAPSGRGNQYEPVRQIRQVFGTFGFLFRAWLSSQAIKKKQQQLAFPN